MTGLDTNVLVRYLAQDDPDQAPLATRLIEGFTAEAPGFVPTVTLVETAWVLARAYRTPRAAIADIIEGLMRARELVLEQVEVHHLALALYRAGALDYADAVIITASRRAGCEEVATFDRKAAKTAGMRMLTPV